jgi:hypothetical protein
MNSKSVIEAAGRIGDLCRETMGAIADNELDEAKRSADLALVVSLGIADTLRDSRPPLVIEKIKGGWFARGPVADEYRAKIYDEINQVASKSHPTARRIRFHYALYKGEFEDELITRDAKDFSRVYADKDWFNETVSKLMTEFAAAIVAELTREQLDELFESHPFHTGPYRADVTVEQLSGVTIQDRYDRKSEKKIYIL